MIYTIKVPTVSGVAQAATEAELLGIPFTKQEATVFDIVITEQWKFDYFLSKIGHADIISTGGIG